MSLLLRFLGTPASPEPPPRQLVVTPKPVRPAGSLTVLSARAADEPPVPRPLIAAQQWRLPAAAAIVLAPRADPPAVADEPPVPKPLVVVAASRLTTTGPIITWTRTDPDPLPRPLVITPSTGRVPGVALTLRSAADVPVVGGDIPPWPALVVTPRRATSTTSALILSPRFGEPPAGCPPPTPRPVTGTTARVVATLTRPSGGETTRVTGITTRVTGPTVRPTGTTVRPTGTTTRPSSGTTPRTTGTTPAPDTGDSNRPASGATEPC